MTDLYDFLVKKYGYSEPIFTSKLKEELDMKPGTFRQKIKRLSDKGLIKKAANGIYFIPSPYSILKNPVLSVEKIVEKKFLREQDEVIGYKTGINFANSLGLTSQTASMPTIVTNNTSSNKREVSFYNKRVIIRKPRKKVTARNYKVFQILDLIEHLERISEEPLSISKYKMINYLKDVEISENEFKEYLNAYPDKTKIKIYEAEIYNEIAQKQRSI